MIRLLAAMCTSLLACSCASAGIDRSELEGTYLTARRVGEGDAPSSWQGSFQCLRIVNRGGDRATIEVVLVDGNGFSCSVGGEARWTRDGLEFAAPAEAWSEESPCAIRLEVRPRSIVLDDSGVGRNCHSYYCGAGAPLQADFMRSERSRDLSPCPEVPDSVDEVLEYERYIERRLEQSDEQ